MVAAERHIDGEPGFYLATEENDAEFFAVRRRSGGILSFDIDDDFVDELQTKGAIMRPIPMSPMSATFIGDELYIPTECFDAFNEARAAGRITVRAI